jgi:putative membrane protein
VPGVTVSGAGALFVAALVLGLLNTFIRPLIILLTLPFTVISLGLFTLFINGFLFFAAAKIVRGFSVSGFWSAFWAAILFSLFSFLLNRLLLPENHAAGPAGGRTVSARFVNRKVIDAESTVVDEPDNKTGD